MLNLKMLDGRKWHDDEYDTDWGKTIEGYTEGFCYFYNNRSSGELPYPVLKRESDGLITFPPTDEGKPNWAGSWMSEFFGTPSIDYSIQKRTIIHAIELFEGNAGEFVSHGAFLSMHDFKTFKASWKTKFGGSSYGLMPIELEIPNA